MGRLISIIHIFALCAFAEPKELRIGVMEASRPFAWFSAPSTFRGAAVDLWRFIANNTGWKYRFVNAGPNASIAIDNMLSGELDAIVGPISVTAKRYRKVDFSRSFFMNNFGVSLQRQQDSSGISVIGHTLLDKFGVVVPIMIGALLLISIVFYLVDRSARKETERRTLLRGLGDSIWETILILIQGQILDNTNNVLKRFVVLLWLVVSIALFSTVIGTVSSSLTILDQHKNAHLHIKKEELANKKIAVVRGSPSVAEAVKVGGIPVEFDDRLQALKALSRGEAFASIDDSYTMETLIKNNPSWNITMTTLNLKNDEVAFVFPKGSTIVNDVDNQLVTLQDNGFAETICARTLGPKAILCAM